MESSSAIQSEIAKLRHDVEEFAKQFPTIGFEKETMKYKNWICLYPYKQVFYYDDALNFHVMYR